MSTEITEPKSSVNKAKSEAGLAASGGSATAKDCIEIVRRLTERNPQLKESIVDGTIPLEDFALIVVTQWKAFNRVA
jgi:hypothetical protein